MIKFTQVRHLSLGVDRAPAEVYAYISDPENLPQWAAGLGAGVVRSGDHWQVKTPQGMVDLRFTPHNDYGVLDHIVTLPDGTEVHVPMRVLANGEASEVVITLFRQPGMDDAAYEQDAGTMQGDLARLKSLLER